MTNKKHIKHYLVLIVGLLVGTILFWLNMYNPAAKIYIAVLMGTFYVIWGVVHHRLHGDLYLSVVLEYLLFATLGLLIAISLILRA